MSSSDNPTEINAEPVAPVPPRLLYVGMTIERWPDAIATPHHLSNISELSDTLRSHSYDAVLIHPDQLSQLISERRREALIWEFADRGIAMLDPSGNVLWCNPILQSWCADSPVGQKLSGVLQASAIAVDHRDPLAEALSGTPSVFRLHANTPNSPEYLDIRLQPLLDSNGQVVEVLALCRDVSGEVEQQKKLDALHQAGRELAALDIEQLADMSEPERIALLKFNLRRYIHDLLHYDTIEVRLLDRETQELKPLLEDGMTPEAATRKLYAKSEGNGVTGYVAQTGRSYLCPDTATDPHYILGASGARSSMTVPLIDEEGVVGTLNVESPHPNFFGPDDLQFTELFSREIASALHTLSLLSAQQTCAATQALDLVNRELALPVDDIVASAAALMKQCDAGDETTLAHLRRIVQNARLVKENIKRVETQVVPPETALLAGQLLAGKKVLVIEQDERMRKSAHLMIERLGAECETAGTASEGTAMLAASDYDAVFLEVRPIDLGGYDTYKQLLAVRPGIRIAMTTGFGYDSAHSLVKARQDGLKYVLFKPFKQEQVVNAVLAVLPAQIAPKSIAVGTC